MLLLWGNAWLLHAQVTLSLLTPPEGVIQKSQLWNMALVYTGDGSLGVYIKLSLLGARDNRPLMTAVTKTIYLTRGARQLNATDISPVQYNYVSPLFNIVQGADGFLPIGNYKACYTVYKMDNELVIPLAEDCMPVEVQPLSPPLLHNPADTTGIDSPFPQFNWLPAVPINLFSDLNYDLLLVEVLPGQAKADAIQKNLPVYNINYCKTSFNNYPASMKGLDTGKIYAWKVVAKNADEPVAQSEVWTFKVKPANKQAKESLYSHYVLLQDDLTGIYTLRDDTLRVKYFSFEPSHSTSVLFSDESDNSISNISRKLLQGDNYLDFPIGNRFAEGKTYIITISGMDGKKHLLRFSISKK